MELLEWQSSVSDGLKQRQTGQEEVLPSISVLPSGECGDWSTLYTHRWALPVTGAMNSGQSPEQKDLCCHANYKYIKVL